MAPHLLSNAVKFTEAWQITLSLVAQDNAIAFAVRDTGPGIPPEAQTLIFETFKQLENFLTRHYQGIGQAPVKQLAENMGSRVTLVSSPGEGSTFTATLSRKGPHA